MTGAARQPIDKPEFLLKMHEIELMARQLFSENLFPPQAISAVYDCRTD
jgi:hypothetical protein